MTGFDWVSWGLIRFYWVLTAFEWLVPGLLVSTRGGRGFNGTAANRSGGFDHFKRVGNGQKKRFGAAEHNGWPRRHRFDGFPVLCDNGTRRRDVHTAGRLIKLLSSLSLDTAGCQMQGVARRREASLAVVQRRSSAFQL